MKKNNIILVTGGSGRFGTILRKQRFKNYIFPKKVNLILQKYNQLKNTC